jgi:hypothetical protein
MPSKVDGGEHTMVNRRERREKKSARHLNGVERKKSKTKKETRKQSMRRCVAA